MIKHILADGTELKSIEGRIISPTGNMAAVYRLVAELLIKRDLKKRKPSTTAGHRHGRQN